MGQIIETPDIWRNLVDPMQSLIADLETTWGFDISYCSSGTWSGIVNSTTKSFLWSPKSSAVWDYCSYI